MVNKNVVKILIIIILIVGLSLIIFLTRTSQYQYHSVYREFYLVPLILAAFWFGLRGALLSSALITGFYAIFLWVIWYGLSAEKINAFIEILFLNGIAFTLGILRERENRERRQLRKLEHLAAIGKTVSGIAHDMKAPLIAIAGFSGRMLKKDPEDNVHREYLTVIHREAQRLESMVKDMLEYARPLTVSLAPADLNIIITESLAVVQPLAEAREVALESRLQPEIPQLSLDAARMKQVVINLLTNAIQASPPGASVCVSSMVGGGEATVAVTDQGQGLTPEQKENLFTPFFTTKKEGIGLGLVMVQNIVSAHGGQVEFFDNPPPQPGVTFHVRLPVSQLKPLK